MNTPSSPHYWRDVILTALAPAIWGSTYIVTSELLPPDRPFTAALIRVLPAGLLLLLFTRRFPARRDWGRVFILSALNIGVFQALLFVAAYRLPGGLAAVLGAIQPLLVMVLVWAVDHRAPRLATLWSAVIGVIGMAVLLLSPQTTFEPVGIAAALLGAVCMATGVWLTRRWQLDLPVLPLTGWQLFIGGLMLAPVAWLADAPLPALTLSQYAAYAYLCLAGAVLAYGLWFRGVSRLPTVAVASLGLLSPLTAVVLGWVLLSQSMTGTAFLGLAIVLASVFAVQWTTARSK
ncbi:EamA family transporter [Pectobacterium zantedeschiae]|uniref:EamA family transporter n=1 Tax=Pectobacterium zantedeschiae TaxID=2034769 RepID=UPI00101BFC51|nr:EamA family transporter [Pectobacterium zantedeschiae]RYC37779.1 EamA family transporter [Pectobacterium zantedeschiae]